MHPFHFLADAREIVDGRELADRARRAEAIGDHGLVIPDHLIPQLDGQPKSVQKPDDDDEDACPDAPGDRRSDHHPDLRPTEPGRPAAEIAARSRIVPPVQGLRSPTAQ